MKKRLRKKLLKNKFKVFFNNQKINNKKYIASQNEIIFKKIPKKGTLIRIEYSMEEKNDLSEL
jgi:hypothetical protein